MRDRIRLRLAQTAWYLRRDEPSTAPWHSLLTPEAAQTFAMLSPGDQRHAMSVATQLDQHGAMDSLVTAGLLHDIGKAHPTIRVHLPDRVAKVLLARLAPSWLARIAAWTRPRWPLGGLWMLSRHASMGARLVREWGYPERVAWLVAHHEDRSVTDPDLALLVAVDDGRPLVSGTGGLAHG